MRFSPRIHPQVRRLIDELDDDTSAIATIWREVGRQARRRKHLQPSYESVRRRVQAQRGIRRRDYSRLKRAAVLAFELVWRTRDPDKILLDIVTGDDLYRRLHMYQRRPRDKSSRARTPGAA